MNSPQLNQNLNTMQSIKELANKPKLKKELQNFRNNPEEIRKVILSSLSHYRSLCAQDIRSLQEQEAGDPWLRDEVLLYFKIEYAFSLVFNWKSDKAIRGVTYPWSRRFEFRFIGRF